MKSVSYITILISFAIGILGAATAMLVKESWAVRLPVPPAMPSVVEDQYPVEYMSALEVGSKFPDELCYDRSGVEHRFDDIFEKDVTVLLFWTPKCQSCVDQAQLWDSTMQTSLMPSAQAVVCLPLHYRDTTDFPRFLLSNKRPVFYDLDRFQSLYDFMVMPIIVAVDNQGFIVAIQYACSNYFTSDLIEAATKYEVGPCVPSVSLKR